MESREKIETDGVSLHSLHVRVSLSANGVDIADASLHRLSLYKQKNESLDLLLSTHLVGCDFSRPMQLFVLFTLLVE